MNNNGNKLTKRVAVNRLRTDNQWLCYIKKLVVQWKEMDKPGHLKSFLLQWGRRWGFRRRLWAATLTGARISYWPAPVWRRTPARSLRTSPRPSWWPRIGARAIGCGRCSEGLSSPRLRAVEWNANEKQKVMPIATRNTQSCLIKIIFNVCNLL